MIIIVHQRISEILVQTLNGLTVAEIKVAGVK